VRSYWAAPHKKVCCFQCWLISGHNGGKQTTINKRASILSYVIADKHVCPYGKVAGARAHRPKPMIDHPEQERMVGVSSMIM
jgi:hypothetical protein